MSTSNTVNKKKQELNPVLYKETLRRDWPVHRRAVHGFGDPAHT